MSKETFKIGLGYDKHTESTGGYDPNDSWSRDSTDSSWYFDSTVTYTEDTDKWYNRFPNAILDYSVDFEPEIKDTLYLVIAVWSTGDSFGHDSGHYAEIFGCFKDQEDATELKLELSKTEGEYNFTKGSVNYPWNGYFDSLNYIKVLPVVVTGKV